MSRRCGATKILTARLHLDRLGVTLKPCPGAGRHIGVPVNGPFKPDYRY